MNYYYDVLLNFDMEHLWNFYEWEENDIFTHVRKIPLYRVDYETMKDFLSYQVQVSSSFLEEVAHKTITQNKDDIYASFLMSDSKNSLAVLLNEEGKVIALSKLLVVDDNNVNEFMYTIRETKISYQTFELREQRKVLRQEEKIKQFILLELKTLFEERNEQKLKYLYYECFSYEEESLEKMYDDMVLYLKEPMNTNLEHLSYLIRLSYHQV